MANKSYTEKRNLDGDDVGILSYLEDVEINGTQEKRWIMPTENFIRNPNGTLLIPQSDNNPAPVSDSSVDNRLNNIEQELTEIKSNQTNGEQKVTQHGSIVTINYLEYTDDSIIIPDSEAYMTTRIDREKFNFIRVYINFDNNLTEEQANNINIYIGTNNTELSWSGTASGAVYEIEKKLYPVRISSSNEGGVTDGFNLGAPRILISDGDIPLHHRKFNIIINNETGEEKTVREVAYDLIP